MPRQSNEDRILAEFPILAREIERIPHVTKVNLTVARADTDFMWRQERAEQVLQETKKPRRVIVEHPALVGLFDNDPDLPRQVRRHTWPDRPGADYVRDHLWKWARQHGSPTALVWLVQRDFHASTSEDWVPGKFLSREVHGTVYKPPTLGWQKLLDDESLADVMLTSRRLLDGEVRQVPAWLKLGEDLLALSKRLENDVYLNGLKDIIDATSRRSMTGVFGDITLMTYILAGRINLQIERGDVVFNSLGADGEIPPRFGPQATEGTYRQICQLTEDFIARWRVASQTERERTVQPSNASFGLWRRLTSR